MALAGTGYGAALASICAVGIVAVTTLEALKFGPSSLGALLLIPVVASAWLLGDRLALVVSTLAIAARLIGGVSGVDFGTALSEVSTLGALAIATRVAAVQVVEGRKRAAKAEGDRRALELFRQRERIARAVTDTATRRLYALTIRLQALSGRVDHDEIKPALTDAIAEADALTAEFRGLIFNLDD